MQAFRAPISDKNSLETYFRADFLDTVNTCAFVKKFNALRRIASFESFKPKDFKAEEEKAKNNFNILGLDMDLVKYPKVFMQREKAGEFLQEEVEYFVGEIRSAYERIGEVTKANFIGALEFLCKSTDDAWICKCFDPRSVMQTFKETMLECDIEMLINKYKPKPKTNKLHKRFMMLREGKGIDTDAVEKGIYNTYVAHFENNVKRCFYASVTTYWDFINHQISFIKTVRQMAEINPEDTETAFENAKKQASEWCKKREEYRQKFLAAIADFYNAFFGWEKEDCQVNNSKTFGSLKKPKCLRILRERLQTYCLWEEPQVKKKEEVPQNPNDKEQNTIVEDKKEPEEARERYRRSTHNYRTRRN